MGIIRASEDFIRKTEVNRITTSGVMDFQTDGNFWKFFVFSFQT